MVYAASVGIYATCASRTLISGNVCRAIYSQAMELLLITSAIWPCGPVTTFLTKSPHDQILSHSEAFRLKDIKDVHCGVTVTGDDLTRSFMARFAARTKQSSGPGPGNYIMILVSL